jgi:hypothetical protein
MSSRDNTLPRFNGTLHRFNRTGLSLQSALFREDSTS